MKKITKLSEFFKALEEGETVVVEHMEYSLGKKGLKKYDSKKKPDPSYGFINCDSLRWHIERGCAHIKPQGPLTFARIKEKYKAGTVFVSGSGREFYYIGFDREGYIVIQGGKGTIYRFPESEIANWKVKDEV